MAEPHVLSHTKKKILNSDAALILSSRSIRNSHVNQIRVAFCNDSYYMIGITKLPYSFTRMTVCVNRT